MSPGYPYRSALITGATSGLGEQFALELAERGADLVLVARRADQLSTVAEQLRTAYPIQVTTLPADLTDPADLRLVEERLADRERPIDLLVNSAGTIGGIRPLGSREPADLEHDLRLNVLAVVRLTRAAVPGMAGRRCGGVLNVSSVTGFLQLPGGAAYSASKAFVTSFSRTAGLELAGLGVHVTVLCPGSLRNAAMANPRARLGPLLEPARVVREGLDAVAAGRPIHIPGWKYRLRVRLARHAPAGLVQWVFHRGWGERNAATLARQLAGSTQDEVVT